MRQGDVLDELSRNPRPSVSRAALAARYPAWGLITMSLFVVGLVVGFWSLGPLGAAVNACPSPGLRICVPKVHAMVVALPVAAMIAGLAVSIVGGRIVVKLRRSPVVAGWLGWLVFAAGVAAAFVLAGLL